MKQPEQHFFPHSILLLSDVSGDNTETPCIHFICMHTLYLPRKGCLPPLISMSSSRSSMHRTGRPVLFKNTFIRQSLKQAIQLLQSKTLLFLVSIVLPEQQWGVKGKLLGSLIFLLRKRHNWVKKTTNRKRILEAGTCS